MASGAEKVEKMVSALRKWQSIERKAMEQTAEIIEQTDNGYLRLLMEIIRHDSLMHHRVEGFLIDSLTKGETAVTNEDIGAIWENIQAHDETEKEVVGIARELREIAWSPVHKHLLGYLLTDEEKHDWLLEQLDDVKKALARATQ